MTLTYAARKPEARRESREQVAARIEKALGDMSKLPMLPGTAQKALKLANEGKASLAEFAEMIRTDVGLATSILKLVNSPIYSWGRTVDSLEQAVVRLGIKECHNLIVAIGLQNIFKNASPGVRARCELLWKHSFIVACLCRQLNRCLSYDFEGEEFTGGLLHDLGRILLAVIAPDVFVAADRVDFKEGDGLLEGERAAYGQDHCTIGATFAQGNRLPHSICQTIRWHHTPEEAKDHRGLIGLVALADHLANHLHRREPLDAYDLDENPGFRLLGRGWDEARVTAFRKLLPTVLDETARSVAQGDGRR
jgi:HD-like signal output (HDOD) protein